MIVMNRLTIKELETLKKKLNDEIVERQRALAQIDHINVLERHLKEERPEVIGVDLEYRFHYKDGEEGSKRYLPVGSGAITEFFMLVDAVRNNMLDDLDVK